MIKRHILRFERQFLGAKKALIVLKIFKYLFWFFGHVGKRLDKNAEASFKIYGVRNWEQIITIHILPNMSRSKGNQAIIFGGLIEYKITNIFLQNSYTKYGRKTSLRPFSRKSKLIRSLDQQSKVFTSKSKVSCPSRGLLKNIDAKV